MILQLDVGNTRIKWRLKESSPEGGVTARGVLPNEELSSLPAALSVSRLSSVVLSNVASAERRDALVGLLEAHYGVPVREARPHSQQGRLRNSYQDPATMGVDRWLAMLAASERYPDGVAIVDAGSALTVDFVSPTGEHLGGYIVPGVTLMERALRQDTARVPFQSGEAPPSSPGHSTQGCVSAGLAWLRAGIMRQVHDDIARYGLRCVVLTGGDAGLMCQEEDAMTVVVPELVLDGLDLYWRLASSDQQVTRP